MCHEFSINALKLDKELSEARIKIEEKKLAFLELKERVQQFSSIIAYFHCLSIPLGAHLVYFYPSMTTKFYLVMEETVRKFERRTAAPRDRVAG